MNPLLYQIHCIGPVGFGFAHIYNEGPLKSGPYNIYIYIYKFSGSTTAYIYIYNLYLKCDFNIIYDVFLKKNIIYNICKEKV